MCAATGFSCPYATLAVGLRLALADYRDHLRDRTATPRSLVDAIEIPRARAFVVVLLNAALCEAAINTALALHFEPAEWAKLERKSTVAKWATVPKRLWPDYSLPSENPLRKELEALFACRHSIMHAQAEVFDGLVRRHVGNFPGRRKDDYNVIDGAFDLSLRLLEHLGKRDPNAWLHHTSIRLELMPPT